MTSEVLIAIPLFVFRGMMLERSRIAPELLEAMARLFGPVRGGLAVSVTLVGALLAASTGIVGATVVTMGLIALPAMMRHRYDPAFACGTICAAGTLGQIIPPSTVMVILGEVLAAAYQQAQLAQGTFSVETISVGQLFAGSMVPGLMLAGIYILYILALGVLRPAMVPAISREERATVSKAELAGKFFRVVAPPIGLVAVVLGSIIAGVAAPSEAASMGALGSIVVAALGRRLSLRVLTETVQTTTKITAMVLFILICAQVFALAFRGLHGEKIVQDLFAFLPGGVNADIWFLMFLIFVLGFFIEWIEISYIAVPLFLPIFTAAGVDMIWLATLICVNLQTSFLTPPFGWSLFFLRGVAPPAIKTMDIYRGIVPFVLMQILALVLVFFFPPIATWLPKAIGW
jgi:tripartite ATP-independent transporter DctM subunit